MKKKLKNIFLVILVIVFVLYLAVTAIMDLTNKKDIHTVTVSGGAEILSVEHSINGLIPVGTDHYYLVFEKGTEKACLVLAPKKWGSEHFDTEGNVTDPDFTITSLAKRIDDFEVREELAARTSMLGSEDFLIAPDYALTLDYKVTACLKLFFLIATAALGFWGYKIASSDHEANKTAVKIFVILVIADLVALLKVIL